MHFNAIVAVVGALASATTAYPSPPGHGNGNGRPSNAIGNIQLGPRPGYLVDMMDDSKLKSKLQSCSTKRSRTTDFSISHRGAALQVPEHTKESWLAAARTGAGLIECDLAFTQDRQLVCRHSQCDLHTTTNILAVPELAAKCTKPFTPASNGTSASAKCCTSDITLDEFKSLCGKMDGADDQATTVEEYMDGTAKWRTDLYASSCGTLMSHKEFIRLVDSLGLRFTSELKAPEVKMPFQGNYTQELYAQQLIDEYKEAHISPRRVWPQSFNVEDIYYWIKHEPEFGKQAVYLDDRVDTSAGYEQAVASMGQLRRRGVRIVSPPIFALLALDSSRDNKIVPSEYARAARRVGLDIIAWSLERSGPLTEVADNGDYFYTSIAAAIKDDGDMYEVVDVLARKVGVLGLFSDWPATVTYYANCFGL